MKNFRSLLCMCLLVLAGRLAPAEPPENLRAVAAPVKIGVIAPLTGGLSDRGEEIVRTLKVYEKTYLNGESRFRYKFLVEDGKNGIGGSATTAAHKLIDLEEVRFLITATSGETMQAGQIAERARVVTIGVLAVVPEIRDLGDYVFRTYMDIEKGLERLVTDLKARYPDYALLSEEAPFTVGIKNILKRISGNKLTAVEEFAPDNQDYRTMLLRFKNARPAAFYVNCASPASFIPLMRQLRELGFTEPVYTYFMPAEPAVQKALGRHLEGVRFLNTPPIVRTSPGFQRFMREYKEAYPEGPKVDFLIRSTHDALKALIDSVNELGPDPEKVKDRLYGVHFAGALGEVSFDGAGDIRDLDFALMEISHGEIR